jgi:hypothetical protein
MDTDMLLTGMQYDSRRKHARFPSTSFTNAIPGSSADLWVPVYRDCGGFHCYPDQLQTTSVDRLETDMERCQWDQCTGSRRWRSGIIASVLRRTPFWYGESVYLPGSLTTSLENNKAGVRFWEWQTLDLVDRSSFIYSQIRGSPCILFVEVN